MCGRTTSVRGDTGSGVDIFAIDKGNRQTATKTHDNFLAAIVYEWQLTTTLFMLSFSRVFLLLRENYLYNSTIVVLKRLKMCI